ncbi:CHAD domain-containing protein, partial [Cellulomonas triticagri]
HGAPRRRTDALLHEARKQARTARYAAEVARPALGRDAKRYARAMEALQEVLGEHQDTVVARDRLAGLAHETADPRAAYAYGRLHAQEEARGRDARHRARRVADRAARPRVRRWLG